MLCSSTYKTANGIQPQSWAITMSQDHTWSRHKKVCCTGATKSTSDHNIQQMGTTPIQHKRKYTSQPAKRTRLMSKGSNTNTDKPNTAWKKSTSPNARKTTIENNQNTTTKRTQRRTKKVAQNKRQTKKQWQPVTSIRTLWQKGDVPYQAWKPIHPIVWTVDCSSANC